MGHYEVGKKQKFSFIDFYRFLVTVHRYEYIGEKKIIYKIKYN